ncbi:MAG: MerR family transcriptional regulator [Clostridia bacterium]|nr:MerR family transcriptional regulator [Clostridia bacterium]
MKTVNELSKITGLSKRTIRYYDQINLLKPEVISESGYRLYGNKSLEILQQILIFRELNVPLEDIKEILDNKQLDKLQLLKSHKQLLILKRDHLNDVISLVDKIINNGDDKMSFEEFNISKIEQTMKHNSEFLKNYDKSLYNKDFDYEKTINYIRENPEIIKLMYGSLENYNETLKTTPERIKNYKNIKSQMDEIDRELGKSQDKDISSPEIQSLIGRLDELMVEMCGIGFKQIAKTREYNKEVLKDPQKLEKHKKDLESISKVFNNEFGKGAYEFMHKAINYYLKSQA